MLKILVYRDSFPCIHKIDFEWRVVFTMATEQVPVSKYSAVGTPLIPGSTGWESS